MKYTKQVSVSGNWAKASELTNGTRAKIVSETMPIKSQFDDKDGNPKMQDVAKVRFENKPDTLNVSLNRATINGLVEAFGEDSKDWMNHYLTVHTEKMLVGGKSVRALYLVPEGFEVTEDENGYMVIRRKIVGNNVAATEREIGRVPTNVDYPESEINPEDIPF